MAYNWSKIKKQSWDKFPERQINIDNDKHLFVIRRKDNSIVVVKYIHCDTYISESSFVNYTNQVIDFAKNEYNTSDIVIITNNPDRINETYPIGVKYYLIRPNGEMRKKSLDDSWDQFIEDQLEFLVEWDVTHTYYISSNRYSIIDEEELIMRAIENGNGDIYGYG